MKIEFQGLMKRYDEKHVVLKPMDFLDDIHTLAARVTALEAKLAALDGKQTHFDPDQNQPTEQP